MKAKEYESKESLRKAIAEGVYPYFEPKKDDGIYKLFANGWTALVLVEKDRVKRVL